MPVLKEQKRADGFDPRSGKGSSSCRTPWIATTAGASLWQSRSVFHELPHLRIPGKIRRQNGTLP